jgi:hypothetical protein
LKYRDSRGVPDLDVLNNSKKSLKCRDSRGVSDLEVSDYLKQNSDFEKYHFILRNISSFFSLLFQRLAKTSPTIVAATVSTSSSPQKRPQLAVGNTLRSKFKKGKLPGKYAGVDANYVRGKEGTFDLHILYTIHLFDVGAKLLPCLSKLSSTAVERLSLFLF